MIFRKANRNGGRDQALTKWEARSSGGTSSLQIKSIVSGSDSRFTIILQAGEAIAQYDPIAVVSGQGYKADATNANHANRIIGIALNASASGGYFTTQVAGTLTNAAWSFTDGAVHVGSKVLTQTYAAAVDQWKFYQDIGTITSDTLIIRPERAIINVSITAWTLDGGTGLYFASVVHNLGRKVCMLQMVNMQNHWIESGVTFDHIEFIDENTLKLWKDSSTQSAFQALCF